MGTIDEEFLVGTHSIIGGTPAYGKVLADPYGNHFYFKNRIMDVTDEIGAKGQRFAEGIEGGPMTEDFPTA